MIDSNVVLRFKEESACIDIILSVAQNTVNHEIVILNESNLQLWGNFPNNSKILHHVKAEEGTSYKFILFNEKARIYILIKQRQGVLNHEVLSEDLKSQWSIGTLSKPSTFRSAVFFGSRQELITTDSHGGIKFWAFRKITSVKQPSAVSYKCPLRLHVREKRQLFSTLALDEETGCVFAVQGSIILVFDAVSGQRLSNTLQHLDSPIISIQFNTKTKLLIVQYLALENVILWDMSQFYSGSAQNDAIAVEAYGRSIAGSHLYSWISVKDQMYLEKDDGDVPSSSMLRHQLLLLDTSKRLSLFEHFLGGHSAVQSYLEIPSTITSEAVEETSFLFSVQLDRNSHYLIVVYDNAIYTFDIFSNGLVSRMHETTDGVGTAELLSHTMGNFPLLKHLSVGGENYGQNPNQLIMFNAALPRLQLVDLHEDRVCSDLKLFRPKRVSSDALSIIIAACRIQCYDYSPVLDQFLIGWSDGLIDVFRTNGSRSRMIKNSSQKSIVAIKSFPYSIKKREIVIVTGDSHGCMETWICTQFTQYKVDHFSAHEHSIFTILLFCMHKSTSMRILSASVKGSIKIWEFNFQHASEGCTTMESKEALLPSSTSRVWNLVGSVNMNVQLTSMAILTDNYFCSGLEDGTVQVCAVPTTTNEKRKRRTRTTANEIVQSSVCMHNGRVTSLHVSHHHQQYDQRNMFALVASASIDQSVMISYCQTNQLLPFRKTLLSGVPSSVFFYQPHATEQRTSQPQSSVNTLSLFAAVKNSLDLVDKIPLCTNYQYNNLHNVFMNPKVKFLSQPEPTTNGLAETTISIPSPSTLSKATLHTDSTDVSTCEGSVENPQEGGDPPPPSVESSKALSTPTSMNLKIQLSLPSCESSSKSSLSLTGTPAACTSSLSSPSLHTLNESSSALRTESCSTLPYKLGFLEDEAMHSSLSNNANNSTISTGANLVSSSSISKSKTVFKIDRASVSPLTVTPLSTFDPTFHENVDIQYLQSSTSTSDRNGRTDLFTQWKQDERNTLAMKQAKLSKKQQLVAHKKMFRDQQMKMKEMMMMQKAKNENKHKTKRKKKTKKKKSENDNENENENDGSNVTSSSSDDDQGHSMRSSSIPTALLNIPSTFQHQSPIVYNTHALLKEDEDKKRSNSRRAIANVVDLDTLEHEEAVRRKEGRENQVTREDEDIQRMIELSSLRIAQREVEESKGRRASLQRLGDGSSSTNPKQQKDLLLLAPCLKHSRDPIDPVDHAFHVDRVYSGGNSLGVGVGIFPMPSKNAIPIKTEKEKEIDAERREMEKFELNEARRKLQHKLTHPPKASLQKLGVDDTSFGIDFTPTTQLQARKRRESCISNGVEMELRSEESILSELLSLPWHELSPMERVLELKTSLYCQVVVNGMEKFRVEPPDNRNAFNVLRENSATKREDLAKYVRAFVDRKLRLQFLSEETKFAAKDPVIQAKLTSAGLEIPSVPDEDSHVEQDQISEKEMHSRVTQWNKFLIWYLRGIVVHNMDEYVEMVQQSEVQEQQQSNESDKKTTHHDTTSPDRKKVTKPATCVNGDTSAESSSSSRKYVERHRDCIAQREYFLHNRLTQLDEIEERFRVLQRREICKQRAAANAAMKMIGKLKRRGDQRETQKDQSVSQILRNLRPEFLDSNFDIFTDLVLPHGVDQQTVKWDEMKVEERENELFMALQDHEVRVEAISQGVELPTDEDLVNYSMLTSSETRIGSTLANEDQHNNNNNSSEQQSNAMKNNESARTCLKTQYSVKRMKLFLHWWTTGETNLGAADGSTTGQNRAHISQSPPKSNNAKPQRRRSSVRILKELSIAEGGEDMPIAKVNPVREKFLQREADEAAVDDSVRNQAQQLGIHAIASSALRLLEKSKHRADAGTVVDREITENGEQCEEGEQSGGGKSPTRKGSSASNRRKASAPKTKSKKSKRNSLTVSDIEDIVGGQEYKVEEFQQWYFKGDLARLGYLKQRMNVLQQSTRLSKFYENGTLPALVFCEYLPSCLEPDEAMSEERVCYYPSFDVEEYTIEEVSLWFSEAELCEEDSFMVKAQSEEMIRQKIMFEREEWERQRLLWDRATMKKEDELSRLMEEMDKDYDSEEENEEISTTNGFKSSYFFENLPDSFGFLAGRGFGETGCGLLNGDEEQDELERLEFERLRRAEQERLERERLLELERLEEEARRAKELEEERRIRRKFVKEEMKKILKWQAERRAERDEREFMARLEADRNLMQREDNEERDRVRTLYLRCEEMQSEDGISALSMMQYMEECRRSETRRVAELKRMRREEIESEIYERQWRSLEAHRDRQRGLLFSIYTPHEEYFPESSELSSAFTRTSNTTSVAQGGERCTTKLNISGNLSKNLNVNLNVNGNLNGNVLLDKMSSIPKYHIPFTETILETPESEVYAAQPSRKFQTLLGLPIDYRRPPSTPQQNVFASLETLTRSRSVPGITRRPFTVNDADPANNARTRPAAQTGLSPVSIVRRRRRSQYDYSAQNNEPHLRPHTSLELGPDRDEDSLCVRVRSTEELGGSQHVFTNLEDHMQRSRTLPRLDTHTSFKNKQRIRSPNSPQLNGQSNDHSYTKTRRKNAGRRSVRNHDNDINNYRQIRVPMPFDRGNFDLRGTQGKMHTRDDKQTLRSKSLSMPSNSASTTGHQTRSSEDTHDEWYQKHIICDDERDRESGAGSTVDIPSPFLTFTARRE